MNLLKKQVTFFVGLTVGIFTLWAVELYEQIRDYQEGRFYE